MSKFAAGMICRFDFMVELEEVWVDRIKEAIGKEITPTYKDEFTQPIYLSLFNTIQLAEIEEKPLGKTEVKDELKKNLGVDPRTTSKKLDISIRFGLLEIRRCSIDKRRQHVYTTQALQKCLLDFGFDFINLTHRTSLHLEQEGFLRADYVQSGHVQPYDILTKIK